MAVRNLRVCDVDNKHEDAQPHVFALDGEYYSADLCEVDAGKLTTALGPYIKVAVSVSAKEATKGATTNGGSGLDLGAIREWAAAQTPPIEVAAKGRISGDVVEKYQAAHPETPTP